MKTEGAPVPSAADPQRSASARGLTVGWKLAISTLLLVALVSAAIFVSLTRRERAALLNAEQRAGSMVLELLASAAVAPLEFEDSEALTEELGNLRHNREVLHAAVWAWPEGTVPLDPLAEYRSESMDAEVAPPSLQALPSIVTLDDRMIFSDVVRGSDDKRLGIVSLQLSLARQNAASAASERLILATSGLVALALAGLLIAVSRWTVVRPLDRLLQATRRMQRGEHARVVVTSGDELGRLALGFNTMAAAIEEREERIEAANRQLQRLFDNMGQAIFSFGPDLTIDDRYSAEARRLFQRDDLAGVSIKHAMLEGIPADSLDGQALGMWLDTVFELGAERWDEVVSLAPTELTLRPESEHPTELRLQYRPLVEHGELRAVMVIANDETEKNRLERQARDMATRYERDMAAMKKIVANGTQMFVGFLRSVDQRLQRCAELLTVDRLTPEQTDEVFRHAHTLKGESRAFELEALHRAATELEEGLAHARRVQAGMDSHSEDVTPARLRERLERTRIAYEESRDLFVQASPIGEAVLDQVTVFRKDLSAVLDHVREHSGTASPLRRMVERLAARPFAETLQRLVDCAPTWAAAQGKRATLQVEGRQVLVPADLAEHLTTSLTHLVRNALAHGIELPADRERLGKSPIGIVRAICEANEHGGVRVVVEDDGAGLDEVGLRRRGRTQGLPVDSLDTEALVFAPGVSTSSVVNELSGRGIGMAAVQADMEAAGYRVRVEQRAGRGARFVIEPTEHPPTVSAAAH